ncbi:Glycosyl transferases group 1 [Vibrio sp. B1ASS3]|uniref:glycosyltransferase family 4 protein n=1 Tax=Vibrio sp. B1ASS3 TaxID=2751176 RepID=UPI001ABB4BDF|nr:glycosyltransferase family 4 protein [Vibrio sp. B1ASS3]CAD7817373.1 Glycosyl transferases group 1 [Vibrio sp. B1ASS3]CAE6931131.1 Glycosyl transferases group 1 [Vibrio sp. B1ASS3]
MRIKNVLLISNMYPSESFPYFGSFVRNIEFELIKENFKIDRVVIDKKYESKFKKIVAYIKFYIDIIRNVLFEDYDYIYAHYVSHVSIPLLFCKLIKPKLRIISHVHGGDVKLLSGTSSIFFAIKYNLSKLLLNKSEKSIVPSKCYKDYLSSNRAINSRSTIIYPSGGVNPSIFCYSYKNRESKRLGYAGRLVRSKNVHLILSALRELSDYSLDIVGEGKEKQTLEKMVSDYNLADRVTFIPPLDQDSLKIWYQKVDTLIYPSESESLGLVPLEAIASGVKVVLSDIPAFKEFEERGIDVNMMANLDADSIVSCIKNIYLNKDSDLEANSIQVLSLYSSEIVKENLVNAFK